MMDNYDRWLETNPFEEINERYRRFEDRDEHLADRAYDEARDEELEDNLDDEAF